jgi:hypothetical protein
VLEVSSFWPEGAGGKCNISHRIVASGNNVITSASDKFLRLVHSGQKALEGNVTVVTGLLLVVTM